MSSTRLDAQETLTFETQRRGLFEVTAEIVQAVRRSGIQLGLCVVYCRHTSASLLIQENADPTAARDAEEWFERLAPDGDSRYSHTLEGPDDMPAHLRSAVTSTSETIPVKGGKLVLGTWQGLFLFEHRTHPQSRELVVHIQGSA